MNVGWIQQKRLNITCRKSQKFDEIPLRVIIIYLQSTVQIYFQLVKRELSRIFKTQFIRTQINSINEARQCTTEGSHSLTLIFFHILEGVATNLSQQCVQRHMPISQWKQKHIKTILNEPNSRIKGLLKNKRNADTPILRDGLFEIVLQILLLFLVTSYWWITSIHSIERFLRQAFSSWQTQAQQLQLELSFQATSYRHYTCNIIMYSDIYRSVQLSYSIIDYNRRMVRWIVASVVQVHAISDVLLIGCRTREVNKMQQLVKWWRKRHID